MTIKANHTHLGVEPYTRAPTIAGARKAAMPLRWSIHHEEKLVLATGYGPVDASHIEQFFVATAAKGAKTYGKLLDLEHGRLDLDRDGIFEVANRLARNSDDRPCGPLALVVLTQMDLDMAILVKQRVSSPFFRIFVRHDQARDWLAYVLAHTFVEFAKVRASPSR